MATPTPRELRKAGSKLWVSLVDGLDDPHRLLLLEACRIADRLDALNALISGTAGSWLKAIERKGSGVIVVQVEGALGEARLQANALRQLMVTLLPAYGAAPERGNVPEPPGKAPEPEGEDELDRLRSARAAAAAGPGAAGDPAGT